MDTWKLQKLVYYSQAWHLVWDGEPLFEEHIEAWANGPVVPALYRVHKGDFKIHKWPGGKVKNLTDSQKSTIDAVWDYYGHRSGAWLRQLTHQEQPWIDARDGLAPSERGTRQITHGSMYDYYGSL